MVSSFNSISYNNYCDPTMYCTRQNIITSLIHINPVLIIMTITFVVAQIKHDNKAAGIQNKEHKSAEKKQQNLIQKGRGVHSEYIYTI